MDELEIPAFALVTLLLLMGLHKHRSGHGHAQHLDGGLELVHGNEGLPSPSDHDLVVIIDLGGAGEHEVSVPKTAVTSRDALKRQIVKACLAQLGKRATPKQWREQRPSREPHAMSLVLTFDNQHDPPSRLRLTGKTPVAQILEASCVHAMPT